MCDKYICKVSALCKGKILNKIKFLCDQLNSGKASNKNIPLLVSRWPIMELLVKYFYKSKIHPYYTFPFKDKFIFTEFDLLSG